MQKLFNVIDSSDWTLIILFGVVLMAIVAIIEIKEKEKDDKIMVNGIIMKNDYDPMGFRFLFAWCIFMAVCVGFVTYKYLTMP